MNSQHFFLKTYAITLTFLLLYLLLSGFRPETKNTNFEEITVQRINLVEPNGDLKMVISNQHKQHPGMMDGKNLPDRERPAGIIFFNAEQDEVGGLIYEGNKKDGANFALSIDQYKNDQIMQLRQITNKEGHTQYGLQLWERDEDFTLPKLLKALDSLKNVGVNNDKTEEKLKELNQGRQISAPRMFMGKNYNKETGLFIQDNYGKDRLRIYVDTHNRPKIEVLDTMGQVVKNLTGL